MDVEQAYALVLKDLKTGRFSSLRAAVKADNLDNTNLGRRRCGQQTRVLFHEEQQVLSIERERMLVRWILESEQAGHAFNHA